MNKIKTLIYNNLRAVARLLRRTARRRLSKTETDMVERVIEHWHNRLRAALLWSEPQPAAVGYVIFHAARVGSTLLGDQLHQNPQVIHPGELLLSHRMMHRLKHWTRWLCPHKGYLSPMIAQTHHHWRNHSEKHPAYGFEILRGDSNEMALSHDQMVELLKQRGFSRFIFIERRNVLRKRVSMLLAHASSVFHRAKSPPPPLTHARIAH